MTVFGRWRKWRPRGAFARDVLTLATGNVIAQVTLLAAAPILTRLFQPADFAALAIFVAVVNVLSVIASGRYDFAVMLPEREEDGAHVAVLALTVLCICCGVLLVAVALLQDGVLEHLPGDGLGWALWLVPLSVLFLGGRAVCVRWESRKKRFSTVAHADIGYALGAVSTQIAGGAVFSGAGLGLVMICGLVTGQLVSMCIMLRRVVGDLAHFLGGFNRDRATSLAWRFRKFPGFSMPSGLVSKLTHEVPTFMLAAYFAPEVLGYYALSRRVLTTPMSMLGQAVSNVFFQRISAVRRDRGRSRALLLRVSSWLFLLILAPMVIVLFYAESIFVFVFGAEWEAAGTYAQLLIPMMIARFAFAPIGLSMQAFERQRVVLIWEIVFLVLSTGAFTLGYMQGSPTLSILVYSIIGFLMYSAYFALSVYYAGGGEAKTSS
jgi:O-antigen/teichoic acid export membrane protein